MHANWFPALHYANNGHLKIALSSLMVHLFVRLTWQVVASPKCSLIIIHVRVIESAFKVKDDLSKIVSFFEEYTNR
ncbi:hypothetical protein T10_9353 [Trichinella papuae]|uniref:Uncharacterized protein n=1 Tax=Trichinella papuae TaxID=268474 RepID=A0A0V1ML59_9BILA|nr:hypothetical protein T10_9353 [Trichinella papuae]